MRVRPAACRRDARLEGAPTGQVKVEQQEIDLAEVRLDLANLADCSDDLESGLAADQLAHDFTHEAVIVEDGDTDRHG